MSFFYNQLTFIKLGRGGMNALRIWNLRNHHLVAVGNYCTVYNHNFYLISKEALKPLKVLSIEKDLAESGVIRKTFIKGRGAENLYQNPVNPSSCRIVI
jgi:hypothetical protein